MANEVLMYQFSSGSDVVLNEDKVLNQASFSFNAVMAQKLIQHISALGYTLPCAFIKNYAGEGLISRYIRICPNNMCV